MPCPAPEYRVSDPGSRQLREFELIERYFARRGTRHPTVRLGTGDDAALVCTPPGMVLAVTVDALVEGIHFPEQTRAEDLGHKALAVSLSDLAAMGAQPAWVTLALTLPRGDAAWIEAFAAGFFALAERYGVQLIGGDTTRGPLCVTVQAAGLVPDGEALCRSGARPGDLVYVSGTLGDAALGLRLFQGRLRAAPEHRDAALARLYRPEPRVALGIRLRQVASAAIDLSDGLVADLGHVLDASGVGARLCVDRLPLSPAYRALAPLVGGLELALCGGDDYELCFTVPPTRAPEVERTARALGCPCTVVGRIEAAPGLRLVDEAGVLLSVPCAGYEHFAGEEG
jgi:thiamine-monophosphate kinase